MSLTTILIIVLFVVFCLLIAVWIGSIFDDYSATLLLALFAPVLIIGVIAKTISNLIISVSNICKKLFNGQH